MSTRAARQAVFLLCLILTCLPASAETGWEELAAGLAARPENGHATIAYFSHSGVAVRTTDHLLIFDYIRKNARSGGRLLEFLDPQTFPDVPIVVFISHAHRDHYDRSVLGWAETTERIHYVISEDAARMSSFRSADLSTSQATRVTPDQNLKLLGGRLEVRTVDSTDAGVAFWVTVDGLDILHTGDLALWNWKDDAFETNRDAYLFELKKLAKLERRPDIAFLCADLRLSGRGKLSGAADAVQLLQPKLALAIHNYGQHAQAARALQALLGSESATEVADIKSHGQILHYAPVAEPVELVGVP